MAALLIFMMIFRPKGLMGDREISIKNFIGGR